MATRRATLETSISVALMVTPLSLQAEDPDDASLTRMPRDIRHEAGRRPHVGGVLGHDVAGDEEPVAPEAGIDGHILFTIRTLEDDGVSDDTRPHLELVEHGAGAGVGRFEPAVQRAVEHHVSG